MEAPIVSFHGTSEHRWQLIRETGALLPISPADEDRGNWGAGFTTQPTGVYTLPDPGAAFAWGDYPAGKDGSEPVLLALLSEGLPCVKDPIIPEARVLTCEVPVSRVMRVRDSVVQRLVRACEQARDACDYGWDDDTVAKRRQAVAEAVADDITYFYRKLSELSATEEV